MSYHNDTYDTIEAPSHLRRHHSRRTSWDERGNGIWEWQTAPGVYSREVSDEQLRKLQAIELELVEAPDHARTHVFRIGASARTKSSPKTGGWAGLFSRLLG